MYVLSARTLSRCFITCGAIELTTVSSIAVIHR
jgi:hypothetical protein